MAKILIIDDDPDIVESMTVVLKSKQHEVSVANSGKDGLAKVEDVKPDLIILDVMMENSDKGFDVCRTIKKNDDFKHIPILMLTAIRKKMGMDFQREAGDEAWLPVDDYVDKPLKPEELISKVEKLLKK